jgi:hypothetical protein
MTEQRKTSQSHPFVALPELIVEIQRLQLESEHLSEESRIRLTELLAEVERRRHEDENRSSD